MFHMDIPIDTSRESPDYYIYSTSAFGLISLTQGAVFPKKLYIESTYDKVA